MNDVAADLDRRIANLVRIGRIAEVDTAAARARVTIMTDASEYITTDWLPWSARRAGQSSTWWAPEVDEQVVVLSVGGELRQGIIIDSLYQQARPAPSANAQQHVMAFADGTRIEYDRSAKKVSVTMTSGSVEVSGMQTIKLQAANLELTGNVQVSGDILATGQVSDATRSMSADRALYTGHSHLAPSGATGTPTPPQ